MISLHDDPNAMSIESTINATYTNTCAYEAVTQSLACCTDDPMKASSMGSSSSRDMVKSSHLHLLVEEGLMARGMKIYM